MASRTPSRRGQWLVTLTIASVAVAFVALDGGGATRRWARRVGLASPEPSVTPSAAPSSAPRDLSTATAVVSPSAAPTPDSGARVAALEGDDAAAAPDTRAAPFSFGDVTYTETDCDVLADVSALASAHVAGKTRPTVVGLSRARYPIGSPFIAAQDDAQLRAWFVGAPDSFEGVASRFEAAVHEGSHVWVAKHSTGRVVRYPVREDLTVEVRRLRNFDRSEILAAHLDPERDTYAKVYLEGVSGAQGFNTLLDEYNAYTHSLASRYCTRDLVPPSTRTSARDGILTMMYYVETYLALARTKHPKDYAAILADAGHRRLILTVWARAELWLRRSASSRALGIRDEEIARWVYEPSRLEEVARVRDASTSRVAGRD